MASLLGLGGPYVTHIVLFKFAITAESHVIAKACSDFVALKDACLRDGKKYIRSIKAGIDISVENKTGDFTHVFVVSFYKVADRDYYLQQDPIHAGFAKGLVGVEESLVVDFEDGKF